MKIRVTIVLALVAGLTWGENWPGLAGPNGNFTSTSSGLADQWPTNGPALVWVAAVNGGGFASPIVANGRVFVMARELDGAPTEWNSQKVKGNGDVLYCLDAKDGREVWQHEFPMLVTTSTAAGAEGACGGGHVFTGSTAWHTPVTDGTHVYARGGDGEVRCLSAADGKLAWKWPQAGDPRETEIGGKKIGLPTGQRNASPMLLIGENLLVLGYANGLQGLLMAMDRKTGASRWKTPVTVGNGHWFPATVPVAMKIRDRDFVIIRDAVVDAASGRAYTNAGANFTWTLGHDATRVLSAYAQRIDVPADRVEADKKSYGKEFDWERGLAWRTLDLAADGQVAWKDEWVWKRRGECGMAYSAQLLAYSGQLVTPEGMFGFLNIHHGDQMVCARAGTGEELWVARMKHPIGYGNAVYADGKILYLWGRTLSMVAADAKGYRELASAKVCDGTWASPALADGRLYLRDTAGNVKCLNLQKR